MKVFDEQGLCGIKYANGYEVFRWNDKYCILMRDGGVLSNMFTLVDGKPAFESEVYVNDTTKRLCKTSYKILTAHAEDK